MKSKQIGNGINATVNGDLIILTTGPVENPTNEIVIDPNSLFTMLKFVEETKEEERLKNGNTNQTKR